MTSQARASAGYGNSKPDKDNSTRSYSAGTKPVDATCSALTLSDDDAKGDQEVENKVG